MTVGIIMFADLLFSRNCVGVGICDCCDGSDEVFNPRSNCTNVCEANLMGLKKQALSMHRNIQAGMRVRTEVVEAFKLSRSKDAKQVETLKTEYDALDRILFRMMFLLQVGILQLTNARFARELTRRSVCYVQKEETKETTLQFALLREREHRCGMGDLQSCDFFRSGFFEEDELLHEVSQRPSSVLGCRELRGGNAPSP
jgi:hypothetical protein